jgi:hypothetical protein
LEEEDWSPTPPPPLEPGFASALSSDAADVGRCLEEKSLRDNNLVMDPFFLSFFLSFFRTTQLACICAPSPLS